MKIKLKPIGRTLIFTTLVLTMLYALFMDLIILALASTSALVASLSLSIGAWRARKLIKYASVKPSSIEARMVAGESESIETKIEHIDSLSVYIRHPLKFCTIRPQPCITGKTFTMEFSPKLAGIYKTNGLEIEVESPLKSFSLIVKLPLRTSLTVLPRALPIAIKALELAASLGVSAHETPSQALVGLGTEYAETREFLLGDDTRRIDWKATARHQKLMVKKYHQDVGGALNLIYDLKAAGPVSRDVIATELLKAALTLTEQGTPYSITLVSEANELGTLTFKDARTALLVAVKYALETVETDVGFLYDLITPQSAREVAMLLRTMGLEQLTKIEKSKPLEYADAIAITCLLGDLAWLMNVHEKVKANNRQLEVHVPGKIWLDSPTLEDAYEAYNRQLKLLAMLKKRGIEVKIV